jgi:hypothetical protein
VLSSKVSVEEYKCPVFGFLLVEVVQMELSNEAGEFAQTEMVGNYLIFHPFLIIDHYILPVDVPLYDRLIILILVIFPISTSSISKSLFRNLLIFLPDI